MSGSVGKTLYVGRIELAALLAAAGLSPQEWAAEAPPAVYAWPGAPKWKRAAVVNILRKAKASRQPETQEETSTTNDSFD